MEVTCSLCSYYDQYICEKVWFDTVTRPWCPSYKPEQTYSIDEKRPIRQ